MEFNTRNGIRWVNIIPGEYYATGSRQVISTLLGSCVSACLYDAQNGIAGMNHFLISDEKRQQGQKYHAYEMSRYGLHAMELLINRMMRLGAQRKRLQAKVFGGGEMFEIPNRSKLTLIGEVNRAFVMQFLEVEKIPVVSSSLGGKNGRVIRFDTGDFSVYVKKIQNGPLSQVLEKEWNHLKQPRESESSVELWMDETK